MRKDFSPAELSSAEFYRLLTAVVVPRPIAWVSSTSAEGVDNLAPHSFFTVASVTPPIIQFTSVGRKDSLRNITERGEFVVNLAPAEFMAEVNATGTSFPPDVSEFDAAGVTREPGLTVTVPRVAESPVALECRLHSTQEIGDCVLVFGEVTHAAVSTGVLEGSHPRIDLLGPLARLGRDEWGHLGPVEELARIRKAEWPGDFRRRDGPEA
ncbi:flavin reductase family protein [Arthrobacter globiformis]|uniref:flavin reductase family protein n=1 Tax=Arthrobacter globiformis TaxID=1665 RepID=UPI002791CA40|nr:flavin reductase family protein [Arthrobacter globiformis]MDQ0619593.1 flavin reductase (DIM6/NTAB) family NADH-FMN oxidoreductase RutF [Arthrobacter globiformis]